MRFALEILFLTSTAVNGFIVLEHHNPELSHHREKRQIPVKIPPTFPPGTQYTAQGVPIVPVSYSRAENHATPEFDGPTGLDHYRDFVNDPWKNTENLGQLLSTRETPELRSGQGPTNEDDIWARRTHRRQGRIDSQAQGQSQSQSQQVRIIAANDPNENSRTQVRTRARTRSSIALSQDNRDGSASYKTETENHHFSGGSDPWWEVASRGDDHITYRRRNPNRHYESHAGGSPSLQHMGSGEGKVSARIVDLRSGNDGNRNHHQNPRSQHDITGDLAKQGLHGYGQARFASSYGQQPELKSLDSSSDQYREGNWVRASESDNHVTWRRIGASTSSGTVSEGQSAKTRSNANARVNRGPQQQHYRKTESWTPRYVPNYPILYDRETAAKVNGAGPSIMIYS